MFFQSYEEKMEDLPIYDTSKHSASGQKSSISMYAKFFFFVKDNIEEKSTVLFINRTSFFQIGHVILYPHIKSECKIFTNDKDILQYLRENLIHYLIIARMAFPLSSNTTLFYKIQYDSGLYILKINRDAL